MDFNKFFAFRLWPKYNKALTLLNIAVWLLISYFPFMTNFVSASDYARQAFDRMAESQIPPTPENYELWYHYYAGTNPHLKRSIDILSLNKQPITPEKCTELYRHFFGSEENKQEVIYNANERLQTTLQTVTHLIDSSHRHTETFNKNLSSRAEQLAAPENDVMAIVTQLVQDTRVMLDHNQTLQKQLAVSTKELGDLKQNLDTARQEALRDALTGITNRKGFDIKFLEEAAASIEEGHPLSLLMIDIDFFKKFNDTYGHQTGDQVLKLVGQTLLNSIKGQDTAARFGGEEFAVLLPNTKAEIGARVADVLRTTIAHKEITNKMTKEKLGQITFSIGVAEYKSGESLEECIERADQALYAAKKNGRNRVEISP